MSGVRIASPASTKKPFPIWEGLFRSMAIYMKLWVRTKNVPVYSSSYLTELSSDLHYVGQSLFRVDLGRFYFAMTQHCASLLQTKG